MIMMRGFFVNFGKLIISKKIMSSANVGSAYVVRMCRPQMSGPHLSFAYVVRKCLVRMCESANVGTPYQPIPNFAYYLLGLDWTQTFNKHMDANASNK